MIDQAKLIVIVSTLRLFLMATGKRYRLILYKQDIVNLSRVTRLQITGIISDAILMACYVMPMSYRLMFMTYHVIGMSVRAMEVS